MSHPDDDRMPCSPGCGCPLAEPVVQQEADPPSEGDEFTITLTVKVRNVMTGLRPDPSVWLSAAPLATSEGCIIMPLSDLRRAALAATGPRPDPDPVRQALDAMANAYVVITSRPSTRSGADVGTLNALNDAWWALAAGASGERTPKPDLLRRAFLEGVAAGKDPTTPPHEGYVDYSEGWASFVEPDSSEPALPDWIVAAGERTTEPAPPAARCKECGDAGRWIEREPAPPGFWAHATHQPEDRHRFAPAEVTP